MLRGVVPIGLGEKSRAIERVGLAAAWVRGVGREGATNGRTTRQASLGRWPSVGCGVVCAGGLVAAWLAIRSSIALRFSEDAKCRLP